MKPNIFIKVLRRRTDPLKLLTKLSAKRSRLETLVHVGAHVAQERFAYEAAGYRRILWIEGSPKIYERLAAVIAEHQQALNAKGSPVQHQALCALLADREDKEIDLREFSNDGMSTSIFPRGRESAERWPDVFETGVREHVRAQTLDAVLDRLGFLESLDVLVVDVQGAELLVFKGAEKALGRAKAVITEVSTREYYVGGVAFAELNAFLEKHGFVAMSAPRRHGDMLFLRQDQL
jgi:FkbM family methyltransferase